MLTRKLPIGAEVTGEGIHFRVWSSKAQKAAVVLEEKAEDHTFKALKSVELTPEGNGYFSGYLTDAKVGSLYRYRINDSDLLLPDPASRFQPDGPHGPSQVVDPSLFKWTDTQWNGVLAEDTVIYEMHIGTFTEGGTYKSAIQYFKELREIGITVLEIMPVADFPGKFGWGYDGVNMFAPTRLYGSPDDFRQFVDSAHNAGLAVLLDVVYNHFGPDGNYMGKFSDDYFTDKYDNEWGDALNFDGKNSAAIREFFSYNAHYWIDEYHIDGLRLDATQQIFDSSKEHVLSVITKQIKKAAKGRATLIVAENEPQHVLLLRSYEEGGHEIDALWNDDFHHTLVTALTGKKEAYYLDYKGTPQEFISAIKYGYLYQGQYYKWQKKRRGTSALDIKPMAFINFMENHDQVANSARGLRMHQLTSPGRFRAMTALILLAPSTPMLFQGEEFASSKPFLYFADHNEQLAEMVEKGRCSFLAQFPSIATDDTQKILKAPHNITTFLSCKLDHAEKITNVHIYDLHRDLLKIRAADQTIRKSRLKRCFDGAVLSGESFLIRYFGDEGDDRLLIINLGIDLELSPAPEPLLAPPENKTWTLFWSSDFVKYGGMGAPPPEDPEGIWRIPGHAAIFLSVET